MQIKFYALEKSKLVLTDNPIKESLLHKYERERERERTTQQLRSVTFPHPLPLPAGLFHCAEECPCLWDDIQVV